MVKIRLTRLGDAHTPIYRVVVVDSRKARESDYIDLLGTYAPKGNTGVTKIDAEKAKAWLSKGAVPSDTVKALLVQCGAMPPQPKAPAKTKRKVKTEPPASKKDKGAAEQSADVKADESVPGEPVPGEPVPGEPVPGESAEGEAGEPAEVKTEEAR